MKNSPIGAYGNRIDSCLFDRKMRILKSLNELKEKFEFSPFLFSQQESLTYVVNVVFCIEFVLGC